MGQASLRPGPPNALFTAPVRTSSLPPPAVSPAQALWFSPGTWGAECPTHPRSYGTRDGSLRRQAPSPALLLLGPWKKTRLFQRVGSNAPPGKAPSGNWTLSIPPCPSPVTVTVTGHGLRKDMSQQGHARPCSGPSSEQPPSRAVFRPVFLIGHRCSSHHRSLTRQAAHPRSP